MDLAYSSIKVFTDEVLYFLNIKLISLIPKSPWTLPSIFNCKFLIPLTVGGSNIILWLRPVSVVWPTVESYVLEIVVNSLKSTSTASLQDIFKLYVELGVAWTVLTITPNILFLASGLPKSVILVTALNLSVDWFLYSHVLILTIEVLSLF